MVLTSDSGKLASHGQPTGWGLPGASKLALPNPFLQRAEFFEKLGLVLENTPCGHKCTPSLLWPLASFLRPEFRERPGSSAFLA